MSQNLVSLHLSAAEIAAIEAALTTLENAFKLFIELSADEKRGLAHMGDKSEAFCRQTLIVLAQNQQMLPPSFDLAEAENDLTSLDQLRPLIARLRQLMAKADDTETALGSDILSAALEGYAFAKIAGKGAGLETLREAMA
ncbi:MAG: hypothetical protein KAY13_01070, partial [Zoogloea sp.]|nr:hypothetical protein [Zoogloea sp.]